ncbi:Anthrax toxin receptor 2 [Holothuria leucospilota]|uniref:Anthrax toxin receptor 2 n=1 Tax=Holothuria leucospilota TaxID=206669 RepID=A0A9Q0YI45_HOLLE|nr:Anthrax toxin receptor 2 [Holothuria leucospilota]
MRGGRLRSTFYLVFTFGPSAAVDVMSVTSRHLRRVVKKDPEPAEEPTSSPIVTPAPPKPETPKLVPGPPVVKKWPKVDVSLIGGAGAGGIRPVPVRWGAGGNTEAARHLEKAKQAEVVGQIEIETPGELVPAKPETLKRAGSKYPGAATGETDGCCSCFSTKIFGKCLAPIKSLYDKVSLMRPQPGDKVLYFYLPLERITKLEAEICFYRSALP